MNKAVTTEICKILNKEYLRRLLNKYFIEKGYEHFDKSPNPVGIQDFIESVPILNGIAELVYSIDDINLLNNIVKLEWNIFIHGNKRLFLGYTEHGNITDINGAGHAIEYNGPITIKQLIDIMVDFISETDDIMNLHSRPQTTANDMNALVKNSVSSMPFKRING